MNTYLAFDGNFYKIGKSNNPEKRINELRTANPLIILIGYGEGDEEKYLHNKYEEFRFSREWFKLTEKQVDEILVFLNTERTRFTDLSTVITFGKYKGLQVCELIHDSHRFYIEWFLKNSDNKSFWHKLFLSHIRRIDGLKKKWKKCSSKRSTYKQKINKRKWK